MITQAMCTSFKKELVTGIHDFTSGTGDTFKMALYTSSATLSAATTVYTTTGEVVGAGYTAGGLTLTTASIGISGSVAFVDFNDISWPASTITARGAVIYNSTESNKAVVVLDFGSDKSSSVSDFSIVFPNPDSMNAIVRVA